MRTSLPEIDKIADMAVMKGQNQALNAHIATALAIRLENPRSRSVDQPLPKLKANNSKPI